MRVKNITLGFVANIYEKSKILGELKLVAKNKKTYLILNYNGVNIISGKRVKEEGINICFFNYNNESGFSDCHLFPSYKYDDNILYIKKWITNDIKSFQYMYDSIKLNPHYILNIVYTFYTNNGKIYCNCAFLHEIKLKQLIVIKSD